MLKFGFFEILKIFNAILGIHIQKISEQNCEKTLNCLKAF